MAERAPNVTSTEGSGSVTAEALSREPTYYMDPSMTGIDDLTDLAGLATEYNDSTPPISIEKMLAKAATLQAGWAQRRS